MKILDYIQFRRKKSSFQNGHFRKVVKISVLALISILINLSFIYADIEVTERVMPEARRLHAQSILSDGRVILTGGVTSEGASNETLIYNPIDDSWANGSAMPEARNTHAQSTLLNGKIIVTGGYNASGKATSNTWLYDPSTDIWMILKDMPSRRNWHAQSTLLDGRVVVTGGRDSEGIYNNTWVYDPLTDIWSNGTDMNMLSYTHAQSTLSDGRILVTGGLTPYPITRGRIYNASTNTWTNTANYPLAGMGYHGQSTLNDGNIAVTNENKILVYDVIKNSWSIEGDMPESRREHAQSTLPNGKIIVTGGVHGETGTLANNIWVFTFNKLPEINIITPSQNKYFV